MTRQELGAEDRRLYTKLNELYKEKSIAIRRLYLLNELKLAVFNDNEAYEQAEQNAMIASMWGVPIFATAFIETINADYDREQRMIRINNMMKATVSGLKRINTSIEKLSAELAEVRADMAELLSGKISSMSIPENPMIGALKTKFVTGKRQQILAEERNKIDQEYADRYAPESMEERQLEREAEVAMSKIKADKITKFAIIGVIAILGGIAVLRR